MEKEVITYTELKNKFNQHQLYRGNSIHSTLDKYYIKARLPLMGNVRKGDVFIADIYAKKRPCVVISVVDEIVGFIALSSSIIKGRTTDIEHKCRFLNKGYFGLGIHFTSVSEVKETLVCSFDDTKQINKAIRYNMNLLK